MYPSTTLFIAVGQLAIAILVMFSYPLQVHPCRNSLDKMFHSGDTTSKAVIHVDGEEEDDVVDEDHGTGEMSSFKHATLTAGIVTSGFVIAYFVDDLQTGEFIYVSLVIPVTIPSRSTVVCWVNGVHNSVIHPARIILLEGLCAHRLLIA